MMYPKAHLAPSSTANAATSAALPATSLPRKRRCANKRPPPCGPAPVLRPGQPYMSLDSFREALLSQTTSAVAVEAREALMAMERRDLRENAMPLTTKTASVGGTSSASSKRPSTREIRTCSATTTKARLSSTTSSGAARSGVRVPMSCETHHAAAASQTCTTCISGVRAPRIGATRGGAAEGSQGRARRKR